MSDSSQPKNSYTTIISDDLINEVYITSGGTGANMSDISVGDVWINSGTGSQDYISTISINNAGGTYTLNSGNSDTIILSDLNIGQFDIDFQNEWENSFPDWQRIQDMCKKYPGLQIAFDNFKVFYEMVKDDYDNPIPKK